MFLLIEVEDHGDVGNEELRRILIDDSSTPTEVALTKFMSGVFDLAEKSNCIGHGLTITKLE